MLRPRRVSQWLRLSWWVPLTCLGAIWAAWFLLAPPTKHRLVIGAGQASGDSYRFCVALREVMREHDSSVDLDVLETAGSEQNVVWLEQRKIDLATVQADVAMTTTATWVATLFDDVYLLFARHGSGIASVADLRGRRIVVPPIGSGQHTSFEFLLRHYGVALDDLETLAMTDHEAIDAADAGLIDGIFHVRALNNPDVMKLAAEAPLDLVPIEQAAALHLRSPALEPAAIPRGALVGHPPEPGTDLPTVLVQRLLLAQEDLDPVAVQEVSRFLFEYRREILLRSQIAGTLTGDQAAVTAHDLPIHAGTRRYLERERPPFIIEQADFIALMMSFIVLAGSGAVSLKQQIDARQKNLADEFTHRIIRLFRDGKTAETRTDVRHVQAAMMETLTEAIAHLDEDRITVEGYSFFSMTWQAVDAALRDLKRELPEERTQDENGGA